LTAVVWVVLTTVAWVVLQMVTLGPGLMTGLSPESLMTVAWVVLTTVVWVGLTTVAVGLRWTFRPVRQALTQAWSSGR